MMIALLIFLVLLLLALGVHVAVTLGLVAAVAVVMLDNVPFAVVAQTAFKSVNSYPLIAIPMFILSGNLMMRGRIAQIMIELVGAVVRVFRGGLALTVLGTSVFFAAVSGSSVGTAAAIGRLTVDGLREENYPPRFSAAIVAVGGTLGLMIPPSLGFILIGSMVGIPVDKLFLAGIVPGLMEASLLAVAVFWLSWKNGYGEQAKSIDTGLLKSRTLPALPALAMPVIVLGSIYTGWLTPTEVSAFAAAYAVVLCMLVYRSVDLRGVWEVSKTSVLQTTMIFAVVMGGSLLGFVLTRMGVSRELANFMSEAGLSWWQFLIIVNVILLIMGMFLDGIAMIVLTAPILFPLAQHQGIDPIHFAVIMVANVEIATLTPPIGLNLFVMSGITQQPVHEVARGVLPFYAVRIVGLALVTFIPAISLALI